MSRFFANLYLDEDVSPVVAALIRSHGYHALTTHEAGQRRKSDPEQLIFATAHQMAIVTHNRNDFLALAEEYWEIGRHHSGIIIAIRRPPREIADKLLALIDRVTADEMDDQLYVAWRSQPKIQNQMMKRRRSCRNIQIQILLFVAFAPFVTSCLRPPVSPSACFVVKLPLA